MPPQILILAGPNGAGKSTCAARFLPKGTAFVNADEIAREISAMESASRDLAAGRLLLQRIAELERCQASFAVETNLANRAFAAKIPRWRNMGYQVSLFFVWIPSADMAVERVAFRVRSGGHFIPEATIRRRYVTGLRFFFEVYQPLVDAWRCYDNSRATGPVLIAHSLRTAKLGSARRVRVKQPDLWEKLQQELAHEK